MTRDPHALLETPDGGAQEPYPAAVLILVAVTEGRHGLDQSPMAAAGAGTEGPSRKSGR